jgi:hypothetical protein
VLFARNTGRADPPSGALEDWRGGPSLSSCSDTAAAPFYFGAYYVDQRYPSAISILKKKPHRIWW